MRVLSMNAYVTPEDRLELIQRLERIARVEESENLLILQGKRFEVSITNTRIEVREAGHVILTAARALAEGILTIISEKSVRVKRVIRTRFQHERLEVLLDIAHDTPYGRVSFTHPIHADDDPSIIREEILRIMRLLPLQPKPVVREREEWIPLHVQGSVNPRILRLLPREE